MKIIRSKKNINLTAYSWKILQRIVENIEFWKHNFQLRDFVIDEKKLLKLYSDLKKLKTDLSNINCKINKNTLPEIGLELKKKKQIMIKQQIILNHKLKEIVLSFPNEINNLSHKKENKIIDQFSPEDKMMDTIDYQTLDGSIFDVTDTSNIFGKKHYTLLPNGVKLYLKLLSKIRKILYDHKFQEIKLPLLITENNLYKSGQLPKFRQQLFCINNNSFLSPTAEVAICSWLNNINLDSKDDNYFCSFSECFRHEKISYGRKNSGILRLFQFSKMEMFKIVTLQNEHKELLDMVSIVTHFFKQFNIPYRVILNSCIETSWHCYMTYDIEVFLPSINDYLEISSCSSTRCLQSERFGIKFIDHKNLTPVMLNGSFLPIERALAILLEYKIVL